jgi:hypothetical protein
MLRTSGVARNEYSFAGTFSADRITKPVRAPSWILAFAVSGFAFWANETVPQKKTTSAATTIRR